MSDLLKKMDENSKPVEKKKPVTFSINHCGIQGILTQEQIKLLDQPIPEAFVKKRELKDYKDSKEPKVKLRYVQHGFYEYILDAAFGKGGWELKIDEYPKDPPTWDSLKVKVGNQEFLTKSFSVHVKGALVVKVNGEWIRLSTNFGSQTAHVIVKDGRISFAMTWGDMLKAACSDLLKKCASVSLGIGRALALDRTEGGTQIEIQQQYPLQHPPMDETEDDTILRLKTMELILDLGDEAQNVIKARMKAVTPEGMVPYTWQTLPIKMVRSLYEKYTKE